MNVNKLLATLTIYLMAVIVFTSIMFYGLEMLLGPNDIFRTVLSIVVGFTSPIGLLMTLELVGL